MTIFISESVEMRYVKYFFLRSSHFLFRFFYFISTRYESSIGWWVPQCLLFLCYHVLLFSISWVYPTIIGSTKLSVIHKFMNIILILWFSFILVGCPFVTRHYACFNAVLKNSFVFLQTLPLNHRRHDILPFSYFLLLKQVPSISTVNPGPPITVLVTRREGLHI